jgi:hypothetical protein
MPSSVDRVLAIDGTAFRAVINIKYAEWLIELEQNNSTWVADFLWPATSNGSLHTGTRARKRHYIQSVLQCLCL